MTQRPFALSDISRRIVRCGAGAASEHDREVRYTVATLANDLEQLDAMHNSMRAGGFDVADCEYLHIDNTKDPQICAYSGLNAMLNMARGRYVILCHQDIRLLTETREDLDRVLADLTQADPAWALAGNAGGIAPGKLAVRITDPHGAEPAHRQAAGPCHEP